MEIAIQKDTHISLHQQLVTQISMYMASGALKPGSKLPSIRHLAKKLEVHHNTCLSAYRELEAVGLIEIRHGSGAWVTPMDTQLRQQILGSPKHEAQNLETLAQMFAQQIFQLGYSWQEALSAFKKAHQKLAKAGSQSLTFVDIHSDILPVFQAELQDNLNRPVKAVLLNQLNPDTERFSHFLVSRYHYQALKEKLSATLRETPNTHPLSERITIIDVGAVSQELDYIRQLPLGSLITVISCSTIILQQAEAVISAMRGNELLIRTILAGQESDDEVQRVLKRSHAIFTDWLFQPHLKLLTRKPIHIIRTIPPHELSKLQEFKNITDT